MKTKRKLRSVDMKIQISNCNNITFGEVEIIENCLNIKYGVNGTGKSTISKAIEAFVNNDETLKSDLVPYRNMADPNASLPTVTGLENINKIAIFNERFVERYLFKENDLFENSFSVFIKTPKYDEHMNEIESLLKDIRYAFNKHPEFNELTTAFSKFINNFGRGNSIAANSVIAKGIGKGNKIKHIPAGLEKYEPYLTRSDNGENVSWLKWQIEGKKFLDMAEQCPYCCGSVNETKETILRVSEEYNSNEISNLNNLLKLLEELMPYFSETTQQKIEEIRNNATNISESQKSVLITIRTEVSGLLNCLTNLQNIGYYSLKSVDKMEDEIKRFVIDISCFPHLHSAATEERITIINKTLDNVLAKASKLQGEINQQNLLIKRTIERNETDINNFLSAAGYNYVVSISNTDNDSFVLLLKPKDVDIVVSKADKHLSYGERNALALALFVFSVLNDNDIDLIILDDPITSFDGNKKFALTYLLFLAEKSFRQRTVLLLTHEFNTVIDIMKVKIRSFNPRPNACFLNTKEGVLREKEIRRDDISSARAIAKKNITLDIDNLIKLIYVRRIKEIEDTKDLVWDITSSIFHKRPVPAIRVDEKTFIDMTSDQKNDATKEIEEIISGFDYDIEYKKTRDLSFLLDLYMSTQSSFEKLQIFRIIKESNSENPIIKKFINESYHVGNDYVWQLNPREFDIIPGFVIEECDKEIASISN